MGTVTKFISTLPTWFVGLILTASFCIAMAYQDQDGLTVVAMLDTIWIYALGIESNRALTFKLNISINKFRAAVIYAGLFSMVDSLFLHNKEPFYLTLSVLFCMGYLCFFVAKSIRSFEMEREAKFGDYSKLFFALWFFPLGVWYIQPKIIHIVTGVTATPPLSMKRFKKAKIEICPHCSKEIDISSILYNKNPLSDIFDLNPFKKVKMIKNYDLIVCPYCQHEYKSNRAKFFGFIKPHQMYLLLISYAGLLILFAILTLLDGLGIIHINKYFGGN